MILKDYGLSKDKFIAGSHTDHKIDAANRLLETFPDFQFLLIGDSGQKDIHVYAQIVRNHADRIRGVFIRDVKSQAGSGENKRLLSEIEEAGVKTYVGEHMEDAVEAARELGFADPGEVGKAALRPDDGS